MEDEEFLGSGNFTDEGSLDDQDPSASTSYFHAQFIAYILIVLVGIIGNVLVFTVMRRHTRTRRTAVNLLLVNLSVADFGVLVIFAPFYLAYDFLDFEWPFGLVLCKAVFSVSHLCLFVSLGTLVVIAVERYKIAFRIPMKKFQVKIAMAGIWLLSLVLTIPQLVMYDLVELEGLEGFGYEELDEELEQEAQHIYACEAVWPDPLYEKILQPVDFVLLYLIPLTFIAAIYGKIIYRLRKANARLHRIRMKHGRGAVKTLTIVVIVFALLNFPIHVFHMYRVFNPKSWNELVLDSPWLFSICVGLVLVMHTANPIIYGIRHGSFRRDVLACIASRTLPMRPRKRETPQTILQEHRSSPEVRENEE